MRAGLRRARIRSTGEAWFRCRLMRILIKIVHAVRRRGASVPSRRLISSPSTTSRSRSSRTSSSSVRRCSRMTRVASSSASSISRFISRTEPGERRCGIAKTHAVFGDHRARDIGGVLQVVVSAGRKILELQHFGGAATQPDRELIAQLLASAQIPIFSGKLQCMPQRFISTLYDRDLVDSIDARQR